jgi:ribosomal protein S18 acetylase RimI-like enzyme
MVTIAKASVADSRDIAQVYVDTWRSTYPGMLPDRVLVGMSPDRQAADWQWLIGNRAPTVPVVVARVAGHGVVGFSSSGQSRAADRLRAGPLADIAGEVFTLYVRPDFQNQGVGRRLLGASFAALRERGYAGAFLWVLSQSPSRFFYERMAGVRAAERRERLWGADVEETAYAWPNLAYAIDRIGSCSISE